MGPKLTVLLTTYNHERFVEQALISVVEQQTSFPFEVVVIEDCSTDATRGIVKAFADAYPGLVRPVLAPANENSNRLFAAEWARSQADYVAMLDGDDYWTAPDKLQRQADLLDAHPECSLCFHDVLVIPEGTTGDEHARFTGPERPAIIDPQDLWGGNFIAGSSPVLRRSLVPELPAWYGEGRYGGEAHGDWALFLLLGQHGPIAYLDAVLGVYRVHAGGIWSRLGPEERQRDIVNILEHLSDVFPQHETTIHAEAARRRRLADAEHRKESRRAALARGPLDARTLAATDAVLTQHVPPESAVLWLEPGLQPVRAARRLLSFPPPVEGQSVLFSSGPQGRQSVRWIAPGHAYDFRLFAGRDRRVALAAVTVVADGAAPGEAAASAEGSPALERREAHVVAVPNPARSIGTHAVTEVSWSTGEGSWGEVLVSTRALEDGLPEDEAAAVAALERSRASGGEYLLLPRACSWWLEAYPALEQHLAAHYAPVADDPVAGRLYDLRGPRRPPPRPRTAARAATLTGRWRQALGRRLR